MRKYQNRTVVIKIENDLNDIDLSITTTDKNLIFIEAHSDKKFYEMSLKWLINEINHIKSEKESILKRFHKRNEESDFNELLILQKQLDCYQNHKEKIKEKLDEAKYITENLNDLFEEE